MRSTTFLCARSDEAESRPPPSVEEREECEARERARASAASALRVASLAFRSSWTSRAAAEEAARESAAFDARSLATEDTLWDDDDVCSERGGEVVNDVVDGREIRREVR